MWDRKKLKSIAKEKFQANYWKCVLVALIFSFIVGGASYSGAGSSFSNGFSRGFNSANSNSDKEADKSEDEDLFDDEDAIVEGAYNSPIGDDVKDAINDVKEADKEVSGIFNKMKDVEPEAMAAFVVVMVLIVGIIVLIAIAIGMVFEALLLNPLEVGCAKFFYKNLSEEAKVSNIASGFDNSYKNGVKVMFFRDLYLILWSMLFIIPGIIKAYEYKMIPYLLAENPDMTKEEAFAESKRMMTGQKWNAFVLDLSFLGWDILSGLFTLGLLSIFFVTPYKRSAQAALYDALKYGNDVSEHNEVAPM